jgi:4-carboxymuconolactone decarboxylase
VSAAGASERAGRLRLCAALAARDPDALAAAMRALLDAADPGAVEEALLQSYLFVGYPVALNALALWRELSGRPAPTGVVEDPMLWARRGAEVLRRVYGGQYDDVRANVRALHPDMEMWMVSEGYGKVLGREGLDLVERELCVVALLAVLDTPRQLYSHLRGARNVGAADLEIEDALVAAKPFASAAAWDHAQEAWSRLRGRAPDRAS